MIKTHLAIGPWVKTGHEFYQRIVCYRCKWNAEVVVHTETMDFHPFQRGYTSGNYFKDTQLSDALNKWSERNSALIGNGEHLVEPVYAQELSTGSFRLSVDEEG